MKRVSVVFTQHEESRLVTAAGLLTLLERISPEVIYLECSPEALGHYFSDSYGRVERTAVSRYRELHPVELVPIDLPTPEASHFFQFRTLLDRVASTGPDLDRLISWNRQYVDRHGFAYLNSAYSSGLLAEQHEVILAALAKLADAELAESYDLWTRHDRLRDTAMVTNIRNHCGRGSFRRAVFLLGAAHRQSIIELANHDADPAGIEWDFGSFLEEPNLQIQTAGHNEEL